MNNMSQSLKEESEISLFPLFKIILKNRWFIIVLTFIGFCFGIAISAISYNKSYCASSSILLQSSQKVTNQDYSKIYFDSIVQNTCNIIANSTTTVRNVILQKYTYNNKNGQEVTADLLKFYNVKDINTLTEKVSKSIKLDYDKKTQVLTISYTAPNPDIASQIVNNIIEQINIFYNTQMTSDSVRNFKFVNEQLKTAKETLDAARLKLALFIKRNKEITGISSPDNKTETNTYSLARLELQNLQEDSKAKEDFYNSLVAKSQNLGIQTVQNIPSVIVLQKAFPPKNPLPRQTLKSGTTRAFFMLIISLGIIFLINFSKLVPGKENVTNLISNELCSDFKKLKNIILTKNKTNN